MTSFVLSIATSTWLRCLIGRERARRNTPGAIQKWTKFLFFRIHKRSLKTVSRGGELVAAMTLEAFEAGPIKPGIRTA